MLRVGDPTDDITKNVTIALGGRDWNPNNKSTMVREVFNHEEEESLKIIQTKWQS